MFPHNSDNSAIKKWVQLGSPITASAVGATLGFFGPVGSVIGAAVTPLLTQVFQELSEDLINRNLSQREKIRVGATFTFAIDKISKKLESGQPLRQDNFWSQNLPERAAAEEILEGVIIASQREHEEKKIKYYGNLFANISFVSEISREQANLLIRLGSKISYHQLCLLNLIKNKHEFKLRDKDYVSNNENGQVLLTELSSNERQTLCEIYDLYIQRIVDFQIDGMIFGKPIADLNYINPNTLTLTPLGQQIYNLMELSDIPQIDRILAFQSLSEKTK